MQKYSIPVAEKRTDNLFKMSALLTMLVVWSWNHTQKMAADRSQGSDIIPFVLSRGVYFTERLRYIQWYGQGKENKLKAKADSILHRCIVSF